ncbi:Uncharacterized protein DBV15_00834 [Temnothorax longispinosus]|uniref:Uncharacterized protein n=1 Tax=Temnothorax longispinosus TaxID=300112 RepID=A0A4S2KQ12_9HYME|nr:Uncharacterized protein DBV15_00834 [Temnothorax longispinosus]
MSHYRARKQRFGWILSIFLLYPALVSSHEPVPANYQNTPGASTLKIEAKESEASITLGKDLVLGPSLSTKASIVADSNDVASTKVTPLASPTIISRVSSGEHAASRRPVSKDAGPRGSYVDSRKPWAGKSPKAAFAKRDSYLQALMHSRNSDDPREGIVQTDSKTKANRRAEYVQGPIYKPETEYGSPDSTYPSKRPRITYGGPNSPPSPSDSYPQPFRPSDYNTPQNSYGPPQNSYGPPNDGTSFYPQISSYGPPGNYLPPQQGEARGYGPSVPTPIYGAPYALPETHISLLPSIDLGLPLALKLNAFTIAKIILKLVIFKMIVKFIAVICLLLFIPKLEIIKKKVSNKDDDDEERNFSSPFASLETLNGLEDIVKSSVEKYEVQNSARLNSTEKCTTLACRITEAFTFHESRRDYLNLFKSYVEEERQLTERRD